MSSAAVMKQVAALRDAPTQVDRLKILNEDKDFVFDFFNATPATGAGGVAISATVGNFPALVDNGMAMTIGILGPCGMNTPHTHPRATEMLFVVNGTLTSGMIAENGSPFIFNTLQTGQAQVFLKGSIHYQQNELCDPVMFVAALNNEDPGVESIAQRYFGLPPDVVAASLGDVGVEEVIGIEAMIPDSFALGRQECLDRCGIQRGTQPTSQREPRNANNALTTGTSSTWPATKTISYSPSSSSTSTHNSRGTGNANTFGALAEDASTVASNGVSNGVLVALCVVVGAMALGYVALGVYWALSRRRRKAERVNRYYARPEMAGRSLVPTDDKYDAPQ